MLDRKRLTLRAVLLASVVAVSACGSPEERAQGHFERAIAFVEQGETERASVEFRNALQAHEGHVPTRRAYADLLRDQGDIHGAVRQLDRLLELVPDDVDANIALAELALDLQNYASVELYAERAFELAPQRPDARALKATVEFRRKNLAAAVELARGVLEEVPDNVPAYMVLMAERVVHSDYEEAVRLADAALKIAPENPDVHITRLAALEQIGDAARIGEQLQTMARINPGDAQVMQALITWHVGQGDNDGVLALLRELAARPEADLDAHLNVTQFILQTSGPDAARSELQRLAESQPDPRPFLRAIAQLDFAQARVEDAVSALERLVEGKEPSAEIRDMKVSLAEMLEQVDRDAEARELVAAVLAEDDRHVGALKKRAGWHIQADRTDLALTDLRHAGAQAPRDPDVMTLMAMAHEREGAIDLAGERLARAVEASGSGAAQSLVYARFLLREKRLAQAENVVLDALQRAPEDTQLLLALGQIHIERRDYVRARQVAGVLKSSGQPGAVDAATNLDLARLQAEGEVHEAVDLLGSIAEQQGGASAARLQLAQARFAAGDEAGAEQEIREILHSNPSDVAGRLMLAGLHVHRGETADAEKLYREVVAEGPQLEAPYQALSALLLGDGRADEAKDILEAGLAAVGRSVPLLSALAAHEYGAGNPEGAIALYEEAYAHDTANVVIANNLASMISTTRADEASLERAFQVARRLRGTQVPHFQDTYGWLLVLRGDLQQALVYLEPAADALSEDPLVRFHLAMAYHGLERWEDARSHFQAALEVGDGQTLPQLATAREKLEEVEVNLKQSQTNG